MLTKVTMRKKIILFFICLVTLPILIIYLVASNIFIKSTQKDLKTIYAANINEVGKSVDTFFNDALDLTLYPLMEPNLKAFLTTPSDTFPYQGYKKNASDILLSMPYGFSSGIHGISITNMENDSIRMGTNTKLTLEDMALANKLNAAPLWDYSASNSKNGYLYLTRLLKNPINISEKIGYIKLAISCNRINSSLRANQQDTQISYFLINNQNDYIIQSDIGHYLNPAEVALPHEQLTALASSSPSSTIIDGRIVSAYSISRTNLLLYSITEPNVLSLVNKTFLINMASISILVFIFSLLLSITFSRVITKPLERLGQYMNSISNENFSVRFHIKGSDEISVLANHFNAMAERLEFLYNEVYLGELKLKQSQLDILQTQINPHFLYNTLDTIYWMSQMGDTKNVSTMVSNMSRMMRLSLAPKTNDKIPLSQELEHLSCYIAIQQVRYGQKITFSLSCSQLLMNEPVLSFLLQPLVENALVHGLVDCLTGIIKISIQEENNTIIYKVANNGNPIKKEEIQKILDTKSNISKGFALRNINERIQLKYGKSYYLSCYTEKQFSIFKIIQPKECSNND